MATAQEMVEGALGRLKVRAAESPLTSDEYNTGIEYLNDLMAALDADGIALGYTTVTSPNDSITIPDGAVSAVKTLLAVEQLDEYSKPLTTSLEQARMAARRVLAKIAVNPGSMNYPDILPRGTGHENGINRLDDRFYPDAEAAILGETGGQIGLEDGTHEDS